MSAGAEPTGDRSNHPASGRRLLVGLTGGLAAGKSTVARRLAERGLFVTDADALVAALYRPGAAGALAVAELFGPEVLDTEGGVDHRALAAIVFREETARGRLEAAIHPLVQERFATIAREAEGVVVYEAALLVEASRVEIFDWIVTVEAPESRRLEFAIARGLDRDDALRRLAAQAGGEARRRAAAHQVIENDGLLDDLLTAADRLAESLRQKLHQKQQRPTDA